MNDRLRTAPDGIVRCWWPGEDPLYIAYHDDEWGYPVSDDRALFQKISLDAFQAGLSWITILRKREAFREAFDGFDIEAVASYDSEDIKRLLANAGIIRHRGKIEATIANARLALDLIDEFGSLAEYLWRFAPTPAPAPTYDIPAVTNESEALSADLRRRGWKFVGPTVVYAFMQAIGMVNDHLDGCSIRPIVEAATSQ